MIKKESIAVEMEDVEDRFQFPKKAILKAKLQTPLIQRKIWRTANVATVCKQTENKKGQVGNGNWK